MKRAGLLVSGLGRVAAASFALILGIALSPVGGLIPLPASAAATQTHPSTQAAAAAATGTPQLATYAGSPVSGSPNQVAQQPFGLAVSGRYTFVADPINRVIRLLINNSELVFAGNGSLTAEGNGSELVKTELMAPYAVAVGHVTLYGPFQVTAFDVFIADTFANQIRKIRVTVNAIASPTAFQTTQICTLAGAADQSFKSDSDTTFLPNATFRSPYGLAWDDAHSILYVADSANNRIRAIHDPDRYDPNNPSADACQDPKNPASIKTVVGPDVVRYPRGLGIDGSGRLYIADTYNNVIRRLNPWDAGGNPIVPTPATSIVAGIPGSGKRVTTYSGDGLPATKALLNQPASVAVDPQGDLYIADTGNDVVREVTTDGVIRTVAGTPLKTGKLNDGGPAILAQLAAPMAVAVRANGDVVIADTGDNYVRILEARLSSGPVHNIHIEAGNGKDSFSGEGQLPSAAQFSTPAAVLSQIDQNSSNAAVPAVRGTRYVLDTFNQVVRMYASPDANKQPTSGVNTLAGLGGVPGAAATDQSGSTARFADPMGMALDTTRNKLYVADTFNNVIRQIDLASASHGVSVFAGQPGKSGFGGDGDFATNALLSYPIGVAVDAAGDVFIADSYNGVVREVMQATKRIYTVAGTRDLGFSGDGGPAKQAGLYFPYGVAVDSATPPNLFISDSFDHRIRRVDAVSPLDSNGKPLGSGAKNTISTVAGDGTEGFLDVGGASQSGQTPASAEFARPWGLTVDHASLVVADFLNNRIRRVDPVAGTVTTLAGTGNAGLMNSVTPPDPADGLPPNPADRPPLDSGPASAAEMNGPRGVSLLGDSGAMLAADSFNNRVRWFGLTQSGIQRTQVNFDPTNLLSTSLPQSVTVTSTGSGLLAMGRVDLRVDAQNFALDAGNNTCGNVALEPGSTCSFQVKFRPQSLGSHTGSVVVPNDAIGGSQLVTLNGQATAPLVTLSPPALAIYQPVNGTASTAAVTLKNNGSGLLEIKQITIQPGTFFSQSNNCPQFMPAQSSCQIKVSLNQIDPTDTVAKSETLVVQDDAAGNPVATESIPLTGSLAQPLASFNRQDLAFAQNVGTAGPPQTFMLVNSGQVPLHLSEIHEDGDFSQTNNCPIVLAPGAGCAINVTFVPSTLGERDGYIVVVDDSLDSPQRIAVTGVATIPSADLGPGRLSFISNLGVATPAQSISLVNHGDGPLTIAGIVATGDFQAQPHCPSALLPGTACSIGITFNPQAAGQRHGTLLVSDDSNGVPGSQQTVLLDGVAHLPIAALSATSLSLVSNLSSSAAQSVTVRNTGDGPLSIRAIDISGPASGDFAQSTNCLGTIQPASSCSIGITFTPHGYGSRGATLTIYDNGPGGAQSVALNGTGTAPRPLLSATYLNFGGNRVGSPSAPQSIVLFNAGNGALTISGISLSGADFNMATTCTPRLDAGASCRITVTFMPRGSGPRSGLVTIVDGVGSQRFTLSGVGI